MISAALFLTLGLVFAAAAAAVAVAVAAVSQVELTRWVAYRLRGVGAAVRLLKNPGQVIATASGVTTVSVLLAAGALPALLGQFDVPLAATLVLLVGVPLFITVVYVVPRVLGRRWAEPLVAQAVPWVGWFETAFAPFVPSRDPTTRTTLAAVLSSAETDTLAQADEIEVVSGVLAFADRPVRELMTPRTAIVAVPDGMLAAEAAHVFTQSGYSRYPVYRGSLDEIVGVTHSFDLLHQRPDAPIVVRAALSVPGTTRAADLMLEMQRGRGHLAVVLDEFGGTAGLVTFEDLLKDLVSEVFDAEQRATRNEEPPPVVELDGTAPAGQLEEALGVRLDQHGVETVGGLLVHTLGRIPRTGERFLYRGLEFDVLGASATRVERVVVRRSPVRAQPLEPTGEPN